MSQANRAIPDLTSKVATDLAIQIPGGIPKFLDPYICFMSTNKYADVKQMEIQDKSGNTWFEMKSSLPLKKIIEHTTDFSEYMK
jgi:hypothetical protein